MADTLLGAVTSKGAAKDEREAKRNPKWILHFAVASNCFIIKVFSPWSDFISLSYYRSRGEERRRWTGQVVINTQSGA
jgi:hypothetical protein